MSYLPKQLFDLGTVSKRHTMLAQVWCGESVKEKSGLGLSKLHAVCPPLAQANANLNQILLHFGTQEHRSVQDCVRSLSFRLERAKTPHFTGQIVIRTQFNVRARA